MLSGEPSKKQRHNDDETEDGQGGEQGKNKGPTYKDPTKTIATIFGGRAVFEDKWEQKLVARCIMSVATYDGPVSDLKYLDWSEHPITFSRADQWSDIPYPWHFPLILDPIIKDVRFEKVLIDGGRALNFLFARSLEELGLKKKDLTPMDSLFWGIIPGKAALPLGQIILSV